jgi:ATP-binding cassette subfamily B protein
MTTIQLLRTMMRARPWLYSANAISWLLIHLFPLLPGLVLQAFFDRLSNNASGGFTPWSLAALLAGIGLAQLVIILLGGMCDITHRFRMKTLLQRNMLQRILERPGAQALPGSTGDALSRFSEDSEVVEDMISWTVDTLGTTMFAIVAVIILFSIDVTITLLVFVPLTLVVMVVRRVSERLEAYRRAASEASGQVKGLLGDLFGGVQAIKVSGAEQRVIARLRQLNEVRRKAKLRDRMLDQTLDAIFLNITNIGTGLILIIAAQRLSNGTLTVGDLALFIYYLNFVTDFSGFLGMYLAQFQQTNVAFERMQALMQGAPSAQLVAYPPQPLARPSDVPAPQASTHEPLLQVTNLGYRYPSSGRGIEQISLSLPVGSLTVLTGRIGSGKTTLLRVLLGLLPYDTGEIRWRGRLVADPASFFGPPHSAYTPQVPRLYSDQLRANLLLGHSTTDNVLEQAIHNAVFDSDIDRLEHGLETVVGPRGVRLSGGQIQRSAAARMLTRTPELLVFDDLSSALDVETERELWQRLNRSVTASSNRPTILAVSHRRALLRQADQVIVLHEGQIVAVGPLADLLVHSPEMIELWRGKEEQTLHETTIV